jgi:Ca2+-binding EF-hand superfamily protein
MKRNEDLVDLVHNKVNNGMLFEEEWKGIIYYLYEENDAKLIEAKLVEDINLQMNMKIQNQINKTKVTRDELASLSRIKENKNISYNSFLKIILDFQIKSRVNFLKNFTYLFKSVDSDNNGIISENEFLTLMNTISYQQKINLEPITGKLLNTLDPFNNKQINYSDCINYISKEIIQTNENGATDTLLNIIVSDYSEQV